MQLLLSFPIWFQIKLFNVYILEKIQTQLTDVKYSSGVFFDLRKAFDTVNHDILLKTLHYYSVRGIVNEWFTSSLKNRKQFVSIRDISSAQVISTGVPQGSFLGLLLFYYIYRPLNYHIFMVCHTVSLSSQSHDSFFSSCGFTDFEWIFSQTHRFLKNQTQEAHSNATEECISSMIKTSSHCSLSLSWNPISMETIILVGKNEKNPQLNIIDNILVKILRY